MTRWVVSADDILAAVAAVGEVEVEEEEDVDVLEPRPHDVWRGTEVDESIVARILNGDSVRGALCSKVTKEVALYEWVRAGGFQNGFYQLTGWKPERYTRLLKTTTEEVAS